jgi:hypothetical protein
VCVCVCMCFRAHARGRAAVRPCAHKRLREWESKYAGVVWACDSINTRLYSSEVRMHAAVRAHAGILMAVF